MVSVAHAEALADGIAASSLRVIDGMGHIPRRNDWLMIAGAIVASIGGSS